MAIPSINTISPNSGRPHGGYLVSIVGSNFRLPNLIADSSKEESVRVYFGTELCNSQFVYVRTENLVDVVVPESKLHFDQYPFTCDVTVQNIDPLGNVIPGEEFTLIDGFTYSAYDLNADTILTQADTIILEYLRRNLGIDINLFTGVDYNPNSNTWVEEVNDPSIILIGGHLNSSPVPTQIYQNINENRQYRLTLPKSYDITWNIIGFSSNRRVLSNLLARFEQVVRVSPYFQINVLGYTADVELFFRSNLGIGNLIDDLAGVQQFTGELLLRGVPTESLIRQNLDTYDVINLE